MRKVFATILVFVMALSFCIIPLLAKTPPPSPAPGTCSIRIDANADGNLVTQQRVDQKPCFCLKAGPVWKRGAGGFTVAGAKGYGGCQKHFQEVPGKLIHASGEAGISGKATAWSDIYIICHSDGNNYWLQLGQPMILFVGAFAKPGTYALIELTVMVCGNPFIYAYAWWNGTYFDAVGWDDLGISWEFDGVEWKAFCYGKTEIGWVDPSCEVHVDLYLEAGGNGLAFAYVGN